MSVLAAQVVIPHDNGIPADSVVNTFHFGTSGVGVDAASAVAITTALLSMYETIGASGNRLATYYPEPMNPSLARIKVYRLNDAPPRVPLTDTSTPMTGGGNAALPAEVALVGSYQAEKVSGVVQSRRRNRFYFGPVSVSGKEDIAGIGSRPILLFRQTMLQAMQNLWTASNLAADWSWVVYSPTIGLAGGTAAVRDAWVDNAWDTQRRRGLKATVRDTTVFS